MTYLVLLLIAICMVVPVSGQTILSTIPNAGSEVASMAPSPRGAGKGEMPLSIPSGGYWRPLGKGLQENVVGMTVLNDDLYTFVEETDLSSFDYRYTMYRWDGVEWRALNRFTMDRGNRITTNAFLPYRGEIYLGGAFTTIDSVDGFKGLARWDGSRWQPVRGGILEQFEYLEFFNLNEIDGKLYCAGAFTTSSEVIYILQFDGSTWSEIGNSPSATPGEHTFGVTTAMYKGSLYLAGTFTTTNIKYLAKWDGSTWTSVPEVFRPVQRLHVYKDELYSYSYDIPSQMGWMARWNGTGWRNGSLGEPVLPGLRMLDFEIFDGDLYVTGIGPSSALSRWDGTSWHTVSTFDNDIYRIATYKGRLAAGGWFSYAMEHPDIPLNRVALLCNGGECGTISGTVFNDADVDCVQDGNERGMQRHIVEMTPGPYYATTDADGRYSLPSIPGTNTLRLIPRLHWTQNCPASAATHTVTIAGDGDMVGDRSFGVRPVANIQDLRASMAAGPARPGFQLVYSITYENAGTVTMNGTVSLLLDPILTFDSSAPPPTKVQGSLLQWDFTALKPGEERTIKVWATVPPTTALGTDICSEVKIDPTFADFSIDDRDSVCVRVTGSYDPNDISVRPFGLEETGEITPEDSVLTYTVRFQNTGTDTAFRVKVTDELSDHLDMTSIIPGAASHSYSFSMSGTNTLTWIFAGIMLPDSGANEANSHGMLKYSVRLKRGLPVGTRIPNRASIYFDYNAPVITNTVESIIGGMLAVPDNQASSEGAAFYPNPARDAITITAEMTYGNVVEVRDMLGRTMMRRTYDGGAMIIDIGSLPAGTYFVRIPARDRTIFQQVSVVR